MEENAQGNDISISLPDLQLAECAIAAEKRWSKILEYAELKRISVSFFDNDKPEAALSKWARTRARLAKVLGKLSLHQWLQAIDPHHRDGHNLRLYYDIWFKTQTAQPFFYWLDVGEGKEVNLDKCTLNASDQKNTQKNHSKL